MHLVLLTARQPNPFDSSLDLEQEQARLERAISMALETARIPGTVSMRFEAAEITGTVEIPDADKAIGVLAPAFIASPYCAAGVLLVRYGAPGAPERRINLATATASLIAHFDRV